MEATRSSIFPSHLFLGGGKNETPNSQRVIYYLTGDCLQSLRRLGHRPEDPCRYWLKQTPSFLCSSQESIPQLYRLRRQSARSSIAQRSSARPDDGLTVWIPVTGTGMTAVGHICTNPALSPSNPAHNFIVLYNQEGNHERSINPDISERP